MADMESIAKYKKKYWKQGWGTLSAPELAYLTDLITSNSLASVLEVGVASGLTAGLIIKSLSKLKPPTNYVGVDINDIFWADQTKKTGYLLNEMDLGNVKCTLHLKKSSVDLQEDYVNNFDLVFIDAQHQHPWPTIDTIASLPLLKKSKKFIVHHDLELFRINGVGIGPKILFDQFNDKEKIYCNNAPNIGYLLLTGDCSAYSKSLANALLLPWNVKEKIPYKTVIKLINIVDKYYDSDLLNSIYKAIEWYY